MNEKDPEPYITAETPIEEIFAKGMKYQEQKDIAEFIHNWIGLRHLCQDAADNGNEESWEYWLKIYKEYEAKLK